MINNHSPTLPIMVDLHMVLIMSKWILEHRWTVTMINTSLLRLWFCPGEHWNQHSQPPLTNCWNARHRRILPWRQRQRSVWAWVEDGFAAGKMRWWLWWLINKFISNNEPSTINHLLRGLLNHHSAHCNWDLHRTRVPRNQPSTASFSTTGICWLTTYPLPHVVVPSPWLNPKAIWTAIHRLIAQATWFMFTIPNVQHFVRP